MLRFHVNEYSIILSPSIFEIARRKGKGWKILFSL